MRLQRALSVLAACAILALQLPQAAVGGSFYIRGPGSCWCNGTIQPQAWNHFTVAYAPGGPEECDFARAAFRIEGVPDDPALQRRFEPVFASITVTGDVFGDGAILDDFVGLPGDTDVGYIWIYAPTALAPQGWSVAAHRGIAGMGWPAADFERAPGVWVPQWSYPIVIGSSTTSCEACGWQPAPRCPFAVETRAWSTIKLMYRGATP